MALIPKTPFLFFKSNSLVSISYPRRALVAIVVVLPIAFGINVPLNSLVLNLPSWGIILINAIIIPSYMTFILPRTTKLLHSWLYPKLN